MRTNELKINQLNFEAPNKTVKLSAVAAAAIQTKDKTINILEKQEELFRDFGRREYNTYMLAKILGVSDSKIGKIVLPEMLKYLGIKSINDSNYNNTIPLGKIA